MLRVSSSMVELRDPRPPDGGLECRKEAGSGLLLKVFPVKLEQKLEEKGDEQKSNVEKQLCVCACVCARLFFPLLCVFVSKQTHVCACTCVEQKVPGLLCAVPAGGGLSEWPYFLCQL